MRVGVQRHFGQPTAVGIPVVPGDPLTHLVAFLSCDECGSAVH
jgi:hypothetical protein